MHDDVLKVAALPTGFAPTPELPNGKPDSTVTTTLPSFLRLRESRMRPAALAMKRVTQDRYDVSATRVTP
jgi:hypothetical protein